METTQIKHIVIFTLRLAGSDQEKKDHLKKIKEALEALPDQIPDLLSMRVAINENPKEATGFILETITRDYEGLASYAKHPAHVAIVEELIAPYKETRSCVDFTEFLH